MALGSFRKGLHMPRPKLEKVTVEELKKEIARRQKVLAKLIAKRDALNGRIAELEGLGLLAKPAAKRGRKPGRKRGRKAGRAPQPGSLISRLVDALRAKGKLSVAEAAAAVLATGYKSKSKSFKLIVNQALAKNKRFKRVGKGLYKLRG
jgi:hypothetical protein